MARLLPLKNILKKVDFIEKIILPKSISSFYGIYDSWIKKSSLGNSDAHILGVVMEKNKSIKELNVSFQNIGIEGLIALCNGLKKNNTLVSLDISGNFFGVECKDILMDLICVNKSIVKLNIDNLNIGYSGVYDIRMKCMECDIPIELNFKGNYQYEERLNVWTHGIGLVLSLLCFILLLDSTNFNNLFRLMSRCIFAFGMILTYFCSSVYHATFQSNLKIRDFWGTMDQLSIYFLIAGSCTPVFLEGCGSSDRTAQVLLFGEWALVVVGIMLNFLATHGPAKWLVELVIYVFMGWLPMYHYQRMYVIFPGLGMTFIIGGGLMYSVGVVFFKLGDIVPFFHVVWHCFVLMGSFCMFFSIFYYMSIDGMTMSGYQW